MISCVNPGVGLTLKPAVIDLLTRPSRLSIELLKEASKPHLDIKGYLREVRRDSLRLALLVVRLGHIRPPQVGVDYIVDLAVYVLVVYHAVPFPQGRVSINL